MVPAELTGLSRQPLCTSRSNGGSCASFVELANDNGWRSGISLSLVVEFPENGCLEFVHGGFCTAGTDVSQSSASRQF